MLKEFFNWKWCYFALIMVQYIHGAIIAGVCITGDMEALEVKSKIEKFLSLGRKQSTIHDVVVVLKGGWEKDVRGNPMGVFMNTSTPKLEEMHAKLKQVVRRTFMIVEPKPWSIITKSPFIKYMDKRHNNYHKQQTKDQQKKRMQSYVVEWKARQTCYDKFLDLESEEGFQYDVFIRFREKSYLLDVMDARIVTQFTPKSILVPSCERDSSLSLNDNGAIISPSAAYDYFYGPLDAFYVFTEQTMSRLEQKVVSPEKFVRTYYESQNINIIHDVSLLPLITLHNQKYIEDGHVNESITSGREWCVRMKSAKQYTASDTCYIEAFPSKKHLLEYLKCI
jgi:hypothetical protein